MEERDQFPYIEAIKWLWSHEKLSSFLMYSKN